MTTTIGYTPPPGFEATSVGQAKIEKAELQDALRVAHEACDRARFEIMPRFRNVAVETKGDGSPVTEADREADPEREGVPGGIATEAGVATVTPLDDVLYPRLRLRNS